VVLPKHVEELLAREHGASGAAGSGRAADAGDNQLHALARPRGVPKHLD
jgi:hypothetical protein